MTAETTLNETQETYLEAVFLFFGCENPTASSGDDFDLLSVTQEDLYGSYWGTLNFGGANFQMCLEIREDHIYFLSSIMSVRYTNFTYTQDEDWIWSFTTYNDSDVDQTGNARCTGTFTVTGSSKTCVATIVPMSASTNPLTIGNNYDGRFDTMEELYGSYWGTFSHTDPNNNTSEVEYCIVFAEDSITTNNLAGGAGDTMVFTDGSTDVNDMNDISYNYDTENGNWSWICDFNGTSYFSGSFNTNGAERTTVISSSIISSMVGTLFSMGEDYNDE